jgi:hypothetical protein
MEKVQKSSNSEKQVAYVALALDLLPNVKTSAKWKFNGKPLLQEYVRRVSTFRSDVTDVTMDRKRRSGGEDNKYIIILASMIWDPNSNMVISALR